RLAADGLERLAERAMRTGFLARALADDVAALAADGLDDLLAVLGVAPRRRLHCRLPLLRIGEEVVDGRVDLDLVADGVLRRPGVRVVPDLRHPRGLLDRTRIANPGFHPVLRQLRVDPGEDRTRPLHVGRVEAAGLVTRPAAGALEGGIG